MKFYKNLLSWLVVGFAILTTGCSLSNSDQPPTLVPRSTATPPPTIGYSTLPPDLFTTQIATTPPEFRVELLGLLDQVNPDRMIIHIDILQNFYTRHVNSSYSSTDRGIGAAYQYLITQFQSIQAQSAGRFTVTPQDFSLTWGGVTSTPKNVIGIQTGTEVGEGVIVIGAHYDSRIGNLEDGQDYAPGANDNGSGVAALIEIARILSHHSHRATLIFVAFSAEEEGRLGSIAFVRDFIQAHNISVKAMIDMDIIGSSTGTDGSVNDRQIRLFAQGPDDSRSRQLARNINFIGSNYMPDMEIVVQEVDDRSGSYGDHMSFSEVGYPAVRFTEMNEEPERRHTQRDTIDDVQASYLVRTTQAILASISVLADGLPPPGNIVLRENGNGTRKLVWETVPGAASYVILLRPVGSLTYQYFETTDSFIDWDGFVPTRFLSLEVAAKDAAGLLGQSSIEYALTR